MAIDERIKAVYQPALDAGTKSIQKQEVGAREAMYSDLSKRGMMSSGLLQSGSAVIDESVMSAYNELNTNIYGQMSETQIMMDEARRQEQQAKDWGLLNTALSFGATLLSPVLGAFTKSAGYAISDWLLGNDSADALKDIDLKSEEVSRGFNLDDIKYDWEKGSGSEDGWGSNFKYYPSLFGKN